MLIPLASDNPHVAAYLRRASDHIVLVVANLDSSAVSGITISSEQGVLSAGNFDTRNLLGGPAGTMLIVDRDGKIRGYAPAASIGPHESLVFELVRSE